MSKIDMVDSELITRLNEIDYPNSLKAWSDLNYVESISCSSLNLNYNVNTYKENNPVQINELHLPLEIMERIVYYFDGITLLKFKLLSETCNTIVQNVLRYHKLWKKICLKEITKKYFIELINKKLHALVSLDSLSEIEYGQLYKNWLQWQCSSFKTTLIGEYHFIGQDAINKIICYKYDVIVVFKNCTYLVSLLKNEKKTNAYVIKVNSLSELQNIFTLVMLNPQHQIYDESEDFNRFVTCHQKGKNVCPLHGTTDEVYHGNTTSHYTGNLIDMDANIYINTCCWVRETWYEWYSNNTNFVTGHKCKNLSCTMFISVVHGVIIGRLNNSVVIHGIYNKLCTKVDSWLIPKYTKATAIYIYTNILFIGTQNSYLLAYRIQCWDDLINLKKRNNLLEKKLAIGQIIKFDIMDFENIRVIVVASKSSVLWIKIN
ncbi:uncharacterized protein LOC112694207 isoform X2 [Sipha flava]|nr:uncharacterized protein LOC112694207 isoform X2 [Sipha flava]XP_025425398.1 uncharacterized protein LOC112694207 isoform X2 [Sipha flava]XP_025425399.1 uncharacterized protein LOC112694207 isoform X2 [Sipha flava]